jgi:hypothetical protein
LYRYIKERHHWKEGRANPRSIDGMENVFDAFCTFAGGRAGAMGVATWSKVLQDTGMYDGTGGGGSGGLLGAKLWCHPLLPPEQKKTNFANATPPNFLHNSFSFLAVVVFDDASIVRTSPLVTNIARSSWYRSTLYASDA